MSAQPRLLGMLNPQDMMLKRKTSQQQNSSTNIERSTVLSEKKGQLVPIDPKRSFQQIDATSPKQSRTSEVKDYKSPSHVKNGSDQITINSFLQDPHSNLQKTLQKRLIGIYQLEQSLQQLIQDRGLSKESELAKLHKAVNHLTDGLERASKSEVELGIKKRELGRNTQEFQDLLCQFESLKKKHMEEEENSKRLYKKIEDLQQQNKQNQHNLLIEQRNNSDLQHKILQLEQRLELVLESDFVGTAARPIAESSQEKLRRTLTELVKECEGYKRDIQTKNKEIERLQEQLKQSQSRVAKINQKVEMMKKKNNSKDVEETKHTRVQPAQDDTIMKNDPTTILVRNELYDSLDFRINSLRSEYAELIHDVVEQGSSNFAQKVSMMTNNKQMRESISLITSQYLSFKDCGEKFNTLIKYAIQLQELPDMPQQMHYLALNFKTLFMSERCNLWILDAQNGILYTLNDQNEQVRALMNRGIFAEVIRFQKPVHKREGAIKALYFETQLGKYQVKSAQGALIRANQTLCYPIFNAHKQVAGILEISNSFADYFSFDEEYYGVILAKIAEQMLNRYIKQKLLEATINFNNKLNDAFWDFNKSTNLMELYFKARVWFSQILTISQMALYFIDHKQQKLITFSHNKQKLEFNWNQGVAGNVRLRKKSLIVMNIRKSFEYDSSVDLDSLLPVFVIPIVLKAKNVKSLLTKDRG